MKTFRKLVYKFGRWLMGIDRNSKPGFAPPVDESI